MRKSVGTKQFIDVDWKKNFVIMFLLFKSIFESYFDIV